MAAQREERDSETRVQTALAEAEALATHAKDFDLRAALKSVRERFDALVKGKPKAHRRRRKIRERPREQPDAGGAVLKPQKAPGSVNELSERLAKAVRTEDLEGVMGCYSQKFRALNPRDIRAQEARWRRDFARLDIKEFSTRRLKHERGPEAHLHSIRFTGDLMLVKGTSTLRALNRETGKDFGAAQLPTVWLLANEDGGWRIRSVQYLTKNREAARVAKSFSALLPAAFRTLSVRGSKRKVWEEIADQLGIADAARWTCEWDGKAYHLVGADKSWPLFFGEVTLSPPGSGDAKAAPPRKVNVALLTTLDPPALRVTAFRAGKGKDIFSDTTWAEAAIAKEGEGR